MALLREEAPRGTGLSLPVRFRAFEPRVVQVIEVHHLRVLQLDLAVTVVALATELEALQHILAEREYCRVIGVQVGVNVPSDRRPTLLTRDMYPYPLNT